MLVTINLSICVIRVHVYIATCTVCVVSQHKYNSVKCL